MSIRVLLVDDSSAIREGLRALLAEHCEFEVVAEACNGAQAIEKAKLHLPDVVLLDITMPELNGLQAAPLIMSAAPRTRILIISQYSSQFFMREAWAVGAVGFLDKRDVGLQLHQAVLSVFSRKRFVSRSLQSPTPIPTPDAASGHL